MRRLLALYILTHLFSVDVGSLLGYGLYPLLHRDRSGVCLSKSLTTADRLQPSQEGKA